MPYPVDRTKLAPYQQELIGKWENHDIPGAKDKDGKAVGGKDNPLSYNIMPLPQALREPGNVINGYILKNFKYYEDLRFNNENSEKTIASAAEAPNRGGLITQNTRAIFYEQQVRFAEGPAKSHVVHVENGMWLWLPRFVQQDGPYPADIDREPVEDALAQPYTISIAKQISVPHGNAVLALGGFDTVYSGNKGECHHDIKTDSWIEGRPVIPDAPFPYPYPETPAYDEHATPSVFSKLDVESHYRRHHNEQNLHPDLTQCPNRPLQEAVRYIKPEKYMHWRVTTEPQKFGQGGVLNTPFEQRAAKVTDYYADYWLMIKDEHKYLAYTQTMLMTMKVQDGEYIFPHVTCNTLKQH